MIKSQFIESTVISKMKSIFINLFGVLFFLAPGKNLSIGTGCLEQCYIFTNKWDQ